jgi:hypothetical protein
MNEITDSSFEFFQKGFETFLKITLEIEIKNNKVNINKILELIKQYELEIDICSSSEDD